MMTKTGGGFLEINGYSSKITYYSYPTNIHEYLLLFSFFLSHLLVLLAGLKLLLNVVLLLLPADSLLITYISSRKDYKLSRRH